MRIFLFVIALALITFGAAIGVLGLLSPEMLPRLGARDGLILFTAGLVIFGIAALVGEIAGLRADLSRLLYVLGGRALADREEAQQTATHPANASTAPSASRPQETPVSADKSTAPSAAAAAAADGAVLLSADTGVSCGREADGAVDALAGCVAVCCASSRSARARPPST